MEADFKMELKKRGTTTVYEKHNENDLKKQTTK